LHHFFKAEETGSIYVFEFFRQVMFFPMGFVEKFHDFETTFIYIKMDVAPLKIGSMSFPNPCIRIS